MERLTKELFSVLINWYEENKRTLPWRGRPSPYEVWVSEIMLQQTRVETVKPYFTRWMKTFPTVFDLAKADEETVLKQWEGLGYYSRARNLHKAAQIVVSDFDGKLPEEKKSLQKLPGIGAYTAGAILSIAFGVAEPAVDGNVMRVISRLTTEAMDGTKEEVRASVADRLRPLMPEGKTSDFTQALFEIGALICLPDDEYRCEACPLTAFCRAYKEERQKDFPVKPIKPPKKVEQRTILVFKKGDLYGLKKRPEKGLLAGLYELPGKDGFLSVEDVKVLYGGDIVPLPPAKHVFTHIVWEMTGYLIKDAEREEEELIFASPEEISKKYSLPSAFSTYKLYCK